MGLVDAFWARARDLGRMVGNGVADSGHTAVYLRQLLRGNRAAPVFVAPPQAGRSAGAGAPPVLLLHGYLATRGSVHLLEQRLRARGHVVMTYRLGLVHLGDIRDSAGLIARKIESLVAQTGVERVDIVAHSMGGLVALHYVKRLGGRHRVRRLIMLGTPIQGTWSAVLGLLTVPLGRASLQLLPGSGFLKELAELPLPPGPEVVARGAARAGVAPLGSTLLAGIRHITLPTGHSGLLVDETVSDLISALLVEEQRDEERPDGARPLG
jgi:pimeloyl-ACP methyl ester carboxylesterase